MFSRWFCFNKPDLAGALFCVVAVVAMVAGVVAAGGEYSAGFSSFDKLAGGPVQIEFEMKLLFFPFAIVEMGKKSGRDLCFIHFSRKKMARCWAGSGLPGPLVYRFCGGGGRLGDGRQRFLPRLPVCPCPPSTLSPCGGGGGFACNARDGFPAATLEPDLSSRPSGWALSRYSKPMMATAYAGGWTLGVRPPSVLAAEKRRMDMAEAWAWSKMVPCAIRLSGGLRCTFLFSWGCLCNCAATAVLEVSGVVCACLYGLVLI